MFLGYEIAPGNRWTRRYLVVDLDKFKGLSLHQSTPHTQFNIKPHITSVVKFGSKGVHFPLKSRYDWYNTTIEGREESDRRNKMLDVDEEDVTTKAASEPVNTQPKLEVDPMTLMESHKRFAPRDGEDVEYEYDKHRGFKIVKGATEYHDMQRAIAKYYKLQYWCTEPVEGYEFGYRQNTDGRRYRLNEHGNPENKAWNPIRLPKDIDRFAKEAEALRKKKEVEKEKAARAEEANPQDPDYEECHQHKDTFMQSMEDAAKRYSFKSPPERSIKATAKKMKHRLKKNDYTSVDPKQGFFPHYGWAISCVGTRCRSPAQRETTGSRGEPR